MSNVSPRSSTSLTSPSRHSTSAGQIEFDARARERVLEQREQLRVAFDHHDIAAERREGDAVESESCHRVEDTQRGSRAARLCQRQFATLAEPPSYIVDIQTGAVRGVAFAQLQAAVDALQHRRAGGF